MFTNQKMLGIFLLIFIFGTGIYFAISKFKQEVRSVSASPSPSPSGLEFLFGKSPASTNAQQNPAADGQQAQVQQQAQELPLAKNKQLPQFPGILKPEVLQNKKAIIQTAKGNIEFEVYTDAPMAASNFVLLAANGFYDGLTLHRVEDWVVQGGDPTGTGSGGPGYQFEDEPVEREYVKGVVAMANAGPNTNGSQFFILKTDYPLPPKYTIFGQVITGLDVVDQLAIGDIMQKVTIQNLQ